MDQMWSEMGQGWGEMDQMWSEMGQGWGEMDQLIFLDSIKSQAYLSVSL